MPGAKPQSFTGIDGAPQWSGCKTRIPVNLGPTQLCHETDSIGGSGDRCPMLFSNDIAVKRKLVSYHGYDENGDGMLLFPHDKGTDVANRFRPLPASNHGNTPAGYFSC